MFRLNEDDSSATFVVKGAKTICKANSINARKNSKKKLLT